MAQHVLNLQALSFMFHIICITHNTVAVSCEKLLSCLGTDGKKKKSVRVSIDTVFLLMGPVCAGLVESVASKNQPSFLSFLLLNHQPGF